MNVNSTVEMELNSLLSPSVTRKNLQKKLRLTIKASNKTFSTDLRTPSDSHTVAFLFRWEPSRQYWSSEGFFDVKFDEGKQSLSFRTINFGIFALSAFRFSNLPLQSWELKLVLATILQYLICLCIYNNSMSKECTIKWS